MKYSPSNIRRAFSLIEVLLAVFILAIGLIMVASIFPVGADWTRQSTENSVGQNIALDALSIIQSHYPAGTLTPTSFSFSFSPAPITPAPTNVQPLPSLTTRIPINERCYQFGNAKPYPVPNPTNCLYYWTALARVNPGDYSGGTLIPAATHRYDLYIMVFRKGNPDQTFGSTITYTAPDVELLGARDPLATPININITYPIILNTTYDPHLEPAILSTTFRPGIYTATLTPPITGAIPPIGAYGIGQSSGTVFRQGIDITASPPAALARPSLMGTVGPPPTVSENAIYAPPADGTSVSPLIYVYQTTICQ